MLVKVKRFVVPLNQEPDDPPIEEMSAHLHNRIVVDMALARDCTVQAQVVTVAVVGVEDSVACYLM